MIYETELLIYMIAQYLWVGSSGDGIPKNSDNMAETCTIWW